MKVLLATDGSQSAEIAGSLLARLPHSERLQLTIMAVNPIFQIYGPNKVLEWMKRVADTEKELASKVCEHLAKEFEGADSSVEIVVADGSAGSAIVSEAKSRQSDLIVIGAIGHSTLERVMQGSVSDFVATHAPCSVFVVRPNAIPVDEFRICYAYDDSSQCKNALHVLSQFKWGSHTHLDLVHAVSIPLTYSDVPIAYDMTPFIDEMKEVLSKAAIDIGKIFPKIDSHVFEANHVGASIVDFAERHNCNLIVLGDTGHGLLSKFLLGSVSRFVLRHAKCSVWIGRKL